MQSSDFERVSCSLEESVERDGANTVAEGVDAVLGQAGRAIGNRRVFCCSGASTAKKSLQCGCSCFSKNLNNWRGPKDLREIVKV